MELTIYKIDGKETEKKQKLDKAVFGIEPNDHAIYLDVKQYMANSRQGTHKSKERGEITGSTKKLHKQKGTGGSRKGDAKNPIFRHGGRAFGPRPKSYNFKLNKKLKKLARKSALTYKVLDKKITIVDSITFDEPKTKDFVSFLNNFGAGDKKVLIVITESQKNIYLSSRNLQNTNVMPANEINTYEILDADIILMTKDSIGIIQKILN